LHPSPVPRIQDRMTSDPDDPPVNEPEPVNEPDGAQRSALPAGPRGAASPVNEPDGAQRSALPAVREAPPRPSTSPTPSAPPWPVASRPSRTGTTASPSPSGSRLGVGPARSGGLRPSGASTASASSTSAPGTATGASRRWLAARRLVVAVTTSRTTSAFLPPKRGGLEGFDLCRAALGLDEERCQRLEMSRFTTCTKLRSGASTSSLLRRPLPPAPPRSWRSTAWPRSVTRALRRGPSSRPSAPTAAASATATPTPDGVEAYPGSVRPQNPGNWWVPTLAACARCRIRRLLGEAAAPGRLRRATHELPQCRGFVRREQAAVEAPGDRAGGRAAPPALGARWPG